MDFRKSGSQQMLPYLLGIYLIFKKFTKRLEKLLKIDKITFLKYLLDDISGL